MSDTNVVRVRMCVFVGTRLYLSVIYLQIDIIKR